MNSRYTVFGYLFPCRIFSQQESESVVTLLEAIRHVCVYSSPTQKTDKRTSQHTVPMPTNIPTPMIGLATTTVNLPPNFRPDMFNTLDDHPGFLEFFASLKSVDPKIYHQFFRKFTMTKEQLRGVDRYYKVRMLEVADISTMEPKYSIKLINKFWAESEQQQSQLVQLFERDLEEVNSIVAASQLDSHFMLRPQHFIVSFLSLQLT